MTVVKFPYGASRRVHSRRRRRSKNGTPEERAAKAAAQSTAATVIKPTSRATLAERRAEWQRICERDGKAWSDENQRLAKAAEADPTLVEFIQKLRAYLVEEFARGRDIDQIFGDLEESYRQVEKALGKRNP